MTASLRPRAVETRDLERIHSQLADLYLNVGIMLRAAEGRLPWGFCSPREKRAWFSDLERAADDVDQSRRRLLNAARAVITEEAP